MKKKRIFFYFSREEKIYLICYKLAVVVLKVKLLEDADHGHLSAGLFPLGVFLIQIFSRFLKIIYFFLEVLYY